MADCVVLIPVLNRAWRAAPVAESIRATSDARILFLCSPDDEAEQEAVRATGAEVVVTPFELGSGDYARKINHGYSITDEPLLFLGADDLRFHKGWLEAAMRKLKRGIGVVGTNDLGSRRVMRGTHSTHSLVTRAYADEFGTIDEQGKILHEGYPHEFVDDELIGTAKKRKAWAFAMDSVVEHLHVFWGKAPMDELYAQSAARQRKGVVIYQERRHLWQ